MCRYCPLSKHNAPPVVYPVHRPQALAVFAGSLWGVGAVVLAVWFYSHRVGADAISWRDWLAVATLLASAAGAVSFCKTADLGQLVWDGAQWHAEGMASTRRRGLRIRRLFEASPNGADGQIQVQVRVIFDVQVAMLLRLDQDQCAPQWLWVTRSARPERWLDVRRAVYSPIRQTVSRGEKSAVQASGAKARSL